ncbi:Solute carrier family 22 member 5 [Liparis tanakae]|uniref:Solute carrier family 22 member 5 n=1 Tax=Liparis tanakae TaxID=230148 RepID=A0A4Z2ELB5_9TELE|nr:Solute carrier family 22 member 5 [Liparis tanakae]
MVVNLGYYALVLNTSNMHSDPYVSCFLSAVVEVPAYVIALLLLKFCTRHFCQSSTLLLGGVFILCVHLIPGGRYYQALPYILMGAFSLCGGVLCFLLPDTYGRSLPETEDQMQQMCGRRGRREKEESSEEDQSKESRL